MKFRASANPSFPKLAWVADVHQSGGLVTLLHGRAVEVRPDFFIEGVWNGPFEKGEFANSECVFGTGAIVSTDGVRFVTSASTVDCLYYAEDNTRVRVSNCLPLLLAYIHDALDPRCSTYPAICDSVMDGINAYRRDIPTKKGAVRRLTYRNLDVSRSTISESEKTMPPRFQSFKDYQDYLLANYALIAANARDPTRIEPLEICSTQSTGYDTTAVNAIASRYGIDKVFTVSQAKSNFYLAHHDGRWLHPIALSLYRCPAHGGYSRDHGVFRDGSLAVGQCI